MIHSFRESHDNHLPIRSATHPVVSSPVRSPNDDSYLRHVGTSYGSHHLSTILGNSFSFIVSTNHKSYEERTEREPQGDEINVHSHFHQGTGRTSCQTVRILPEVSHPNKIFICEIRPLPNLLLRLK